MTAEKVEKGLPDHKAFLDQKVRIKQKVIRNTTNVTVVYLLKILQEIMVLAGKLVLKDLLDPKDKRGKKDRGCLVSSTYAGAGQAAVEMLRLCTQVSTFW